MKHDSCFRMMSMILVTVFAIMSCLSFVCAETGDEDTQPEFASTCADYSASGTLYITGSGSAYSLSDLADSFSLTEQLVPTLDVLLFSNRVMDRVLEILAPQYPDMSMESIKESLTLSAVENTSFIRITAHADDPNKAANIVNAVLEVFPGVIEEVISCQVIIVDSAHVTSEAEAPASPSYTAKGSMFVTLTDPNSINYGYQDQDSDHQLTDLYTVIITSEKVMDRILACDLEVFNEEGVLVGVRKLSEIYPDLSASFISAAFSLYPISETSFLQLTCTTDDPQLSADILNAILLVAPNELEDTIGCEAMSVDFATVPTSPDPN